MTDARALVEVSALTRHFRLGRGKVLKAVDGVDFQIRRGTVFGLVGESGCGKTTIGRLLLRLLPPTSGRICFDGTDLATLDTARMRALRRRMQIVFQDPYSSLDPRMTVGNAIVTPMKIQDLHPGRRRERAAELLARVGLGAADMERYPHEFSGGQRQRIGIARALAVDPEFIVADEPVSALDVSIRSQVLNLFKELQEELHLTCLFISHDLSVVQFISDQVGIVYMGRIVEMGPADIFSRSHRHPYTRSLLAAIPRPDPRFEQNKPEFELQGEIASPINPPPGCRFFSRCPLRLGDCRLETPPLKEIGAGHWVACFRADHDPGNQTGPPSDDVGRGRGCPAERAGTQTAGRFPQRPRMV
jgi:oligopeptide transport system ATP-binding protein